MTDAEKRQYVRLPRQFRVELREFVFPLTTQPALEISSVDISAGGMRVFSPRRFEEKDKLQVKVYIPSLNKFHPGFMKVFESDMGQYLQAIAEVAWVDRSGSEYAVGIRFLDVDHDDWNALNNLIAKHMDDLN